MALREHAEYLLSEEIGFAEKKFRRIIQIIAHLKLSWELLAQEGIFQDSNLIDLIDLLFLNDYKAKIGEIEEIISDLKAELFRFPSFRNFHSSFSKCQQKVKDLALEKQNKKIIKMIH